LLLGRLGIDPFEDAVEVECVGAFSPDDRAVVSGQGAVRAAAVEGVAADAARVVAGVPRPRRHQPNFLQFSPHVRAPVWPRAPPESKAVAYGGKYCRPALRSLSVNAAHVCQHVQRDAPGMITNAIARGSLQPKANPQFGIPIAVR
jgi:hypothetical protein